MFVTLANRNTPALSRMLGCALGLGLSSIAPCTHHITLFSTFYRFDGSTRLQLSSDRIDTLASLHSSMPTQHA